MTIRQRITLLITSAGIASGILFSAAVFFELLEQPFRILDNELKETAFRLVKEITIEQPKSEPSAVCPENEKPFPYWLRISDSASNKIIYESDLVNKVDLPSLAPGLRRVIFAVVPNEKDRRGHKTAFRVRAIDVEAGGKKFSVQIGRSMENLVMEIDELLLGLLAGFVFSTMALILFSMFVTGKILKPIRNLNDLAGHISEENLEERIPEGTGQDEFSQLIKTINGMLDRLQFSFEKQKRHLADASHELKSPVAMLRLFFEEAAQRNDLPDTFLQQMECQRMNLLRMDRLIKTLLELSILKLKTVPILGTFNLKDIATAVLEDFAPLFEREMLCTETELPENLIMKGNRDQIRQVFINLLDNAVKYNIEGGRIKLSLFEKDGAVHLSLYNTGIGIPKKDLPKVFEQFYRVEKSRSKDYGGVGLGLSIVQEIVRLHRGTIAIDSEPGAWTQVAVSFPKIK